MGSKTKKEEFEDYEKKYIERVGSDKLLEDYGGGRIAHSSNLLFPTNSNVTPNYTTNNSSIFGKIDCNFKSKLEAIVEIDYKNPMDVRERLFFGKQDNPILYSRDYVEKSKNNFIHFKIETTFAKNTKWNYEGTKEIGDNFESGYSLIISFQHSEKTIRKSLIKLLQYYKFGSIPSSHAIHAHLDDENPTELQAGKILNSVVKSFVGEDFSQWYG